MEREIAFVLILAYYLFCIFTAITYLQNEKYSYFQALCLVIAIMIIAPIGTPIVLGIVVGQKLRKSI